jgi:intracellular sulfur oxidation DsrE/DsrF family protein
MRAAAIGFVAALTLSSLSSLPGHAAPPAASTALPVPGYEAAKDLAGAHELPDPSTDYKVVFSVGQDSKTAGEVHQMLPTIATYVNTLAKYGVPAPKRHLVVMFHQRSDDFDIVMSNDAYKARYNGKDNPNIALIHALKEAGVEFRACGQGLFGRKIDPKQVNPDIQIDLWAMTSMVNLAMKGFTRVG